MNEIFLGELFDIDFNRPIMKNSIAQLVEIFPKLVEEKLEVDGIALDEAMNSIISEILHFAEQLEQSDYSTFIELLENELSTKKTESVDDYVSIMNPEETKWKFYIRFKISEPLGLEQELLQFLDKYIIKADGNQSLKDSNTLILTTSDSLIYREIISESKKVEQALILAFAELGIGIAYPKDLASEVILEKIKIHAESHFLQENTKIYDSYYERPLIHFSDKFGVVLFQEESSPWDSKASKEKVPIDIKDFGEIFSSNYNQLKGSYITDHKFKKIEIATSILTTSIFEDSLINKIILSMTVIEVLSERISRTDEELKVLDSFVSVLDDKTNVGKNLIQALDSIRFQSIGKSCRTLVKCLLGGKDAKLFYNLYNYRSQLVHSGILENDSEEMFKIYNDSYDLAKRLLTAYLKRLDATV